MKDSLVLSFPPYSSEPDTGAHRAIVLNNHLLLFPGDYSALVFKKTGLEYSFVTRIPLWYEKKGKVFIQDQCHFQILDQWLLAADYHNLTAYDLFNPQLPAKRIKIPLKKGEQVAWPFFKTELTVFSEAEENHKVYFPVGPPLPSGKSLSDSAYLNSACFEEMFLSEKNERLRLSYLNSGGHFRGDEGIRAAPARFRNVFITPIHDKFIVSSESSHWIWIFEAKGILKDSVFAKGENMPTAFIFPMPDYSESSWKETQKRSGRYGVPGTHSDSKIILRTYQTLPDEGGKTKLYLQRIHLDDGRQNEVELPGDLRVCDISENKLLVAGKCSPGLGRAVLYWYHPDWE